MALMRKRPRDREEVARAYPRSSAQPALSTGFGACAASASRSARWSGRDYDVSPDGQRFVMMRNDEPRASPRIGVLLDWRRALEAVMVEDGGVTS